jgi:glycosyltransferase involved in cell wall biosynthesis
MVDTNKGPQAKLIISVIIPARNEEAALASMLPDIPAWVDHVIVADNGSSDNTANVAQAHGALVRAVPIAGYGRACLIWPSS